MNHHRVNIRKSHPSLYHLIMTLCFMRIALAINFWTSNPTFNPYDWNKNVIGLIFFMLGTGQLVFLNVFHDLRLIRLVQAAALIWTLFWGLSNTQQSFAGDASWQLPILYVALAVLHVPLLIESPVNPMTEKS